MKRTRISDIKQEEGKEYFVGGWIERIKDIGKIKFIWLNDGTGKIQITIPNNLDKNILDKANSLAIHDFIYVKGTIPSKIISKNYLEIIPNYIELITKAEKPLPIDMSGEFESGLDVILDWRSIALRDEKRAAILKIESLLVRGLQDYLNKEGFSLIFTPCIIGAPAEGGSEVFEVKYFDKKAYLRQDPQLHRQLLIIAGFDRVYDIGPSWRAELSHTTRHLCEHRNCAVEMAYIEGNNDLMDLEERLVRHAIKYVVEYGTKELKILNKELSIPDNTRFPVVNFPDIYDILSSMGRKIPFEEDISREDELLIFNYVKEHYDSDFFFINRFPFKVKPFYVMKDDNIFARSYDLEYKGVELSSGGQREHRYNVLLDQIKEKNLNEKNLEWFTKFFRYGAPPHGGFSIGIERFTMQLLNIPNILEVTPFPRTPERMLP